MSRNTIDGGTAIVSGANRGIGLAITRALLDAGATKVYAGARKPDTLASLVEEYGDRVVPIALDVTNEDQVREAAANAKDVDLLVNNAGVAIWELRPSRILAGSRSASGSMTSTSTARIG